MMRLVREILYLMNVCEMFYDPSNSVLQLLQMLKNACECVASITYVLQMKPRLQTMGI